MEDPADRTERIARDVRRFVRAVPRSISNAEDVRQVVRSSGSWLRLVNPGESESLRIERTREDDESAQLVKIYSTIINRLDGKF